MLLSNLSQEAGGNWFESRCHMLILIADDEAKVRSALRLLLEQEEDLHVVGEAVDLQSLCSLADSFKPDLILLDLELPGLQPALHLLHLQKSIPSTRIIALSGRTSRHEIPLRTGIDAFVSKGDPPERVLAAVYQSA